MQDENFEQRKQIIALTNQLFNAKAEGKKELVEEFKDYLMDNKIYFKNLQHREIEFRRLLEKLQKEVKK